MYILNTKNKKKLKKVSVQIIIISYYFSIYICTCVFIVKAEVKSYGKPSLGGPFVMFNQNGAPVTDATYRGKYVLLYFGFTYCPDICPNELVKMGKVVDGLGKHIIVSI